jgi:hypothetical protein
VGRAAHERGGGDQARDSRFIYLHVISSG